jgi:pimeloyl-ACP methyl ester carboxylesterase
MAYFTFQGKKVFYKLDGEASFDTLMILNGIMMSHKSWELFIPNLTQHFQVLRVDMLDQGESDHLKAGYTQALQADMLSALITHIGLEKVHLAGISYGGNVALQFALKYPAQTHKLVLFNAVARTSEWLRDIGRGWNKVAATRDGEAYYHVTIPLIYSPNFYSRKIKWMEKRKQTLIPVFSTPEFLDAMIRLTESAESHDVFKNLNTIETPTLVIAADQDMLTPPHEQEAIVNAMPIARLITFRETGHASMYERPELFITTLVGYLSHEDNYTI